ncbi:MAG: DUF397 domain-containing protein [Streptosporangiales bacterium]|nr:DUF397 domain-containing protein [Streptosporangiales bacterium]
MSQVDSSSALWRKSTRSGSNGYCVEVARLSRDDIGVRDSKDTAGPALVFTSSEWAAFVADVKHGRLGAISS